MSALAAAASQPSACSRQPHYPDTVAALLLGGGVDLVDRLPLWLAPNLITLAASLCILLAYLLNVAYLPDFTGAW